MGEDLTPDVRIHHYREMGYRIYTVMVDGKKFDEFSCRNKHRLSWRQIIEVETSYREALTGYVSPC